MNLMCPLITIHNTKTKRDGRIIYLCLLLLLPAQYPFHAFDLIRMRLDLIRSTRHHTALPISSYSYSYS